MPRTCNVWQFDTILFVASYNFFALKIMYVNIFWFRLVICDKSNYYNVKYQIQK